MRGATSSLSQEPLVQGPSFTPLKFLFFFCIFAFPGNMSEPTVATDSQTIVTTTPSGSITETDTGEIKLVFLLSFSMLLLL